jgi:hypothetical protein
LSLINFYASRYNKLYVVIREDAKKLVEFYIRGIENVSLLSFQHDVLNSTAIHNLIGDLGITGYELIGGHDSNRPGSDPYRNAYYHLTNNPKLRISFERAVYEAYNIPYCDKILKFEVKRDIELENDTYARVVKSEPYICFHDRVGSFYIPNKTDYSIVELAESSELFFDYIKILKNSKEIHLIDSVWAALCYQLDAKYRIFENIPIHVYCFRDFYRMFVEPVRLSNWTIVLKLTHWDSA